MAETVYILMGSNLGDRERNIQAALTKIELIPGLEIIASSALYVSEAMGMKGENPSFMNQAVMVDYQYRPQELLDELEKIERAMGRSNKGEKKPRTIDLDILLFGDEIIQTPRLTIPHAELLNRAFAMIPLVQITPELVHPAENKLIADFIKKRDREKVILYKDHVERAV